MFYNFIRQLIGVDGNEMYWDDGNVAAFLQGIKSVYSPFYFFLSSI